MKRLSNVELLRIVSMSLVLVVHASSTTLGFPTKEYACSSPIAAITQLSADTLSYVCVNVFVLISGWFGIRPNLKGFLSLLFQCLFFNIIVLAFFVVIQKVQLNKESIMHIFFLSEEWWFIKSYIALYIISPVLNAFCNQSDKKTFQMVLVGFYLFQSIYGWLTRSAFFFVDGFSVVSFMGLYLLAKYIRLFPPSIFKSCRTIILIYVSLVLVTIIVLYGGVTRGFMHVTGLLCYTSPLVVLEAVCLLLLFCRLPLPQSKHINTIAKSCFAVYLLHMNPHFFSIVFQPVIRRLYYNSESIITLLLIASFLTVLFLFSIAIDMLRRHCWKSVEYFITRNN